MNEDHKIEQEESGKRHPVTSVLVGLVGAVCALYILNPTAGIFELLPDNLPVVGNLDEAAAVALLISSLAYFGVDLGGLFGRKKKDSDVIDVDDVEVK